MSQEFADFLSYFPKVDLPLTIQYGDLHDYTRSNDPLPDSLLQAFIFPHLPFEIDEFTEFLPCFQFSGMEKLHHVVYWSGRLMHYSFYLVNYNEQGQALSQSEIAGFFTKDERVLQKMAHINEDAEIYIVETNLSEKEDQIMTQDTRKWSLDILPDGQIRASSLHI